MPLNIIRNDISKVSADAIVNSANPLVAIGDGVDRAIYRAAGTVELLAERFKIGPMKPGQAAATPAFNLDAKYIIHTVGPVWEGGDHGERDAVASCYRESLRIADELNCASVAFPLISTGTYGFPKDEALRIAISEISSFLFTHDMTVHMVVYDKSSFVISTKAFGDVKSYIEEQDVKLSGLSSYSLSAGSVCSSRKRDAAPVVCHSTPIADELPEDDELYESGEKKDLPPVAEVEELVSSGPVDDGLAEGIGAFVERESQIPRPPGKSEKYAASLADVLRQKDETFQQMLFRIIDRKGMTDPEVYKKANIDRKLFSKIRSNEQYMPSKRTALAFAVALELSLDETVDLLRRAGLALSPSNRFDLIVGYCINHNIYDIYEINTYLFDYDEPLLVG